MGTPIVTVGLLNWKRPQRLNSLVETIRAQSVDAQVWLWNNGDPVTLPVDRCVQSSKNFGCWPRWKMLLDAPTAYVMTVDDDMGIQDGNLMEKCIAALSTHGHSTIVGAFGVVGAADRNYLGFSHLHRPDRDCRVDVVKGKFMFMRKEALKGLDLKSFQGRFGMDDIIVSAHAAKGTLGCHLLASSISRSLVPAEDDGNGLSEESGWYDRRTEAYRSLFNQDQRRGNDTVVQSKHAC